MKANRCEFCGKEPTHVQNGALYWIYCPVAKCGHSGPARTSLVEATSAWNAISVKARGHFVINIPVDNQFTFTVRHPDGHVFQGYAGTVDFNSTISSVVQRRELSAQGGIQPVAYDQIVCKIVLTGKPVGKST